MKSEANASSQAGLESPGSCDGGDGVRALSGVDGSGVDGAGAGASARGGVGKYVGCEDETVFQAPRQEKLATTVHSNGQVYHNGQCYDA